MKLYHRQETVIISEMPVPYWRVHVQLVVESNVEGGGASDTMQAQYKLFWKLQRSLSRITPALALRHIVPCF